MANPTKAVTAIKTRYLSLATHEAKRVKALEQLNNAVHKAIASDMTNRLMSGTGGQDEWPAILRIKTQAYYEAIANHIATALIGIGQDCFGYEDYLKTEEGKAFSADNIKRFDAGTEHIWIHSVVLSTLK